LDVKTDDGKIKDKIGYNNNISLFFYNKFNRNIKKKIEKNKNACKNMKRYDIK